jgi:hypothetical protein
MKMTLQPSLRSLSGNALVVTLITMAIVGVFVDLSLQYTNSIGRNVQRSLLLRQATNVGDASAEMAFSAWRAICRAKQNTTLPRSAFDTEVPTPTPGDFPGVKFTLLNYAVYPLDSYWATKSAGGATPAPIAGPNHGDLSYYYLASADVVIPTVTSKNPTSLTDKGNVVARVREVFQKETLSLWRYAIFFDDDCEIHPGPQMVINGDVHTNGTLYTGHDTLTLNGKTTYTDDWSIGFKPGDNQHPETPTSPKWATGLPPASDQAQQPYGVAMSDYHELIEPLTGPTDALDTYRFQSQADCIVTIDASNNVKVYDNKGKDVSATQGGIAVVGAITTNQTITDNREGATTGNGSIRLATLDVGKLTTAINTDKLGKFNGVLYIRDTSADPNGITAKRGIRLVNGGKLPDGTDPNSAVGLTIVSPNPVYVQGDYNTGSVASSTPGATPITQPQSNLGDPTQPTVPGYTRLPAAIVADAVNILSNSWVDAKAGTVPDASATTINAGIVSGSVVSGGGYYSGGVENFPRFLEDWGGKNLTYYGSMIELYQSKQSIGRWGAPNVYGAPNRAWYFDTNFIASPPPGLLVSYNYRRSRWYMQ